MTYLEFTTALLHVDVAAVKLDEEQAAGNPSMSLHVIVSGTNDTPSPVVSISILVNAC